MSKSIKEFLKDKGILAELEDCRNEEEAIELLKRENLWGGVVDYPELEALKESYENDGIETDGSLTLRQLDKVAGGANAKGKQVKIAKPTGKRVVATVALLERNMEAKNGLGEEGNVASEVSVENLEKEFEFEIRESENHEADVEPATDGLNARTNEETHEQHEQETAELEKPAEPPMSPEELIKFVKTYEENPVKPVSKEVVNKEEKQEIVDEANDHNTDLEETVEDVDKDKSEDVDKDKSEDVDKAKDSIAEEPPAKDEVEVKDEVKLAKAEGEVKEIDNSTDVDTNLDNSGEKTVDDLSHKRLIDEIENEEDEDIKPSEAKGVKHAELDRERGEEIPYVPEELTLEDVKRIKHIAQVMNEKGYGEVNVHTLEKAIQLGGRWHVERMFKYMEQTDLMNANRIYSESVRNAANGQLVVMKGGDPQLAQAKAIFPGVKDSVFKIVLDRQKTLDKKISSLDKEIKSLSEKIEKGYKRNIFGSKRYFTEEEKSANKEELLGMKLLKRCVELSKEKAISIPIPLSGDVDVDVVYDEIINLQTLTEVLNGALHEIFLEEYGTKISSSKEVDISCLDPLVIARFGSSKSLSRAVEYFLENVDQIIIETARRFRKRSSQYVSTETFNVVHIVPGKVDLVDIIYAFLKSRSEQELNEFIKNYVGEKIEFPNDGIKNAFCEEFLNAPPYMKKEFLRKLEEINEEVKTRIKDRLLNSETIDDRIVIEVFDIIVFGRELSEENISEIFEEYVNITRFDGTNVKIDLTIAEARTFFLTRARFLLNGRDRRIIVCKECPEGVCYYNRDTNTIVVSNGHSLKNIYKYWKTNYNKLESGIYELKEDPKKPIPAKVWEDDEGKFKLNMVVRSNLGEDVPPEKVKDVVDYTWELIKEHPMESVFIQAVNSNRKINYKSKLKYYPNAEGYQDPVKKKIVLKIDRDHTDGPEVLTRNLVHEQSHVLHRLICGDGYDYWDPFYKKVADAIFARVFNDEGKVRSEFLETLENINLMSSHALANTFSNLYYFARGVNLHELERYGVYTGNMCNLSEPMAHMGEAIFVYPDLFQMYCEWMPELVYYFFVKLAKLSTNDALTMVKSVSKYKGIEDSQIKKMLDKLTEVRPMIEKTIREAGDELEDDSDYDL